jgi:ribosome-binding factor A
MGRYRPERLKAFVQENIGDIIQNQLKDPRIGFVSVTSVDVSRDARYARVYVSVFGDDEAKKSALKALDSASGYVRNQLGTRLSMFHTPEIHFRLDESLEHAAEINAIIQDLHRKEGDTSGERTNV